VRDGARQRGGRRRGQPAADAAVEAFADRLEVDVLSSGTGTPGQLPQADPEPDASERITLIEFTWVGLTGTQPVILVAREWLQ
jgi:hypothetical protein